MTLLLFAIVLGATGVGILVGHRLRHLSADLKEPFAILQGALLGLVGLLLAFGLSLAVSRYQDRRTNVVDVANAIGTASLRAETLKEPARSRTLALMPPYTRNAIHISEVVPGSDEEQVARAAEEKLERQLWALAGDALKRSPQDSAPRLYVESLNTMFDEENTRVTALSNRVPTAVFLLEIIGAALALGLLGAYLTISGRGVFAVLLASVLVGFVLLVTADLDRPTRGAIQVPDTPLANELDSLTQPPAAGGP